MNTEASKATLAKRLRLLRKERGMTQTEVAQQLKIANSTLSQYESCKRMPDFDVLSQLIAFYNTSADYLLGLSDQRTPTEELDLSYVELDTLQSIKTLHPALFSALVDCDLDEAGLLRLERLLQAYIEIHA